MSDSPKKVQVVDLYNHLLSYLTRCECSQNKQIHRAVYVFILQKNTNLIFCNKRSSLKPYCPEYYSSCFSGYVLEDETYMESALRNIFDETGLKLDLNFIGSLFYEGKTNKSWGQIFYGYFDGQVINIKDNPQEFEFVELMSYKEIMLREQSGDLFTPESIQALYQLRKKLSLQ
ncbi:hypothetical protein pb186bvf_017840 [Paramecium bursaria]